MVINRKERFATEGIRFQRHNPDGTIAYPRRFIGFANTADLSRVLKNNKASLTIKVDADPAETKEVDFSAVLNASKVTGDEAVVALNGAGFKDITFSIEKANGRLRGAYKATSAEVVVQVTNEGSADTEIIVGEYSFSFGEDVYYSKVDVAIPLAQGATADITFTAGALGTRSALPAVGQDLSMDEVLLDGQPSGIVDLTAKFTQVTNGLDGDPSAKIIQVVGDLAAALDFGQGIKHGGNGLEVISFFDDETISIGLPKDIIEAENIDIEGAKGTITRMVIGAMLQGLSPVVALKIKDYYLTELIQGGKLNRATGEYDPPLSKESDHPTFFAEIFSAVYSAGSNKLSDVAGYEKLLLRSMIGMEGDVPIDAKAWAQYAFNLTATEYTDENDTQYAAWQEQVLSLEQFDALAVKKVKV